MIWRSSLFSNLFVEFLCQSFRTAGELFHTKALSCNFTACFPRDVSIWKKIVFCWNTQCGSLVPEDKWAGTEKTSPRTPYACPPSLVELLIKSRPVAIMLFTKDLVYPLILLIYSVKDLYGFRGVAHCVVPFHEIFIIRPFFQERKVHRTVSKIWE